MELNKKYFQIRDGLFFLICLFLVFTNIPERFHQNFIGFGGHLSGYPILVGFFSLIWYSYKSKSKKALFPDVDKASIFLSFAYLLFMGYLYFLTLIKSLTVLSIRLIKLPLCTN